MKKVGILGSGQVAKTLGDGFLKYGYSVMLGSRDKNKLNDWLSSAKGDATVGSFEETAQFGDMIVLSVSGKAAIKAIELAGPEHMIGKTIIDVTNPIADKPPQNGVIQFFTTLNESLMELLQERFSGLNFVKAFNSVGNAYMVDPDFDSKPTMFICGNNDGAKADVKDVLDKFGWETEDMGMATAARVIEPLCILWCIPGMLNNQWNHAFKLLKQ